MLLLLLLLVLVLVLLLLLLLSGFELELELYLLKLNEFPCFTNLSSNEDLSSFFSTVVSKVGFFSESYLSKIL